MGYTHYWAILATGEQREWTAAMIAAVRILRNTHVPLGDGFGNGTEPEISDDRIWWNGRGDSGCETVCLYTTIDGDPNGGQFCKTGQRPYDVVVTSVLAALEHYAPSCIRVTSDGLPTDWVTGVRHARELLDDQSIGIPRAITSLSDGGYNSAYSAEILADIARAESELSS